MADYSVQQCTTVTSSLSCESALGGPLQVLFGRGRRRRRFFQRLRQGRGRCFLLRGLVDDGGGRRVLDVVGDECVVGGSGVGHGCSLGDELADQGLGHGAQDLLWIFS